MVGKELDRDYREKYYEVGIQRVSKGVYVLHCDRSHAEQIYRGDMKRLKPALREHFARHVEDKKCYLPNTPDEDIFL